MWNICRSAALQALQRTTASSQRLALQSSVLRASAASATSSYGNIHARQFATRDSFAGVELSHLLNSSPNELNSELGKQKIRQVQVALRKEFDQIVAQPQDDVSSDDLMQLFTAAQKTRLPTLMLNAFEYMQQNLPDNIDFVMYGEVFRILSRERAGDKLWEIYEFARPRFEPTVPELIYRFGIVGKIELGEMAAAEKLIDDMQNDGHFVTNEINSRMLSGYAREQNDDKVMEYYEKLDPRMGHWHESSIDRVILALGVAGKADLSFEFYVNSNMKLNGGTLITLLSVCRHNNCVQQANDILENRKRFDLKLDARAYNGILETLEFLDRRGDIHAVLDEMNDEGVRFDTLTKTIVERNQAVLKGTYFDLEAARERSTANTPGNDKRNKNKKVKAFMASPELRNFLQEKKFKEAAALADELVRPMTLEDLPESSQGDESAVEGLLKVQASVAKEVVAAFMGNNEVEKVEALLKGFELSEAKVGYALMEIVTQYTDDEPKRGDNRNMRKKRLSKKQRELAYRAAKLMLHQDWQIHRAGPALQAFREFKDAAAARQLFEQLLNTFTNQSHSEDKSTISATSVSQTLSWTVRTMGENHKLSDALDLLEKASEGFRIEPSHYVGLLSGMRVYSAHMAKSKGVVVLAENYRKKPFYYLSDPFEKVLDDIEKRGVRITRGIVANLCFPLAGGNKRQRLRLLETYAAARANAQTSKDNFDMPSVIYTVLMQVAGKETGNVDEIKQLYQDALESLPVDKNGEPKQRVPLDWEVVMVSHLADAGHVDEAFERLQSMKETCGTYSYEATIKVLRGCLATGNSSLAKKTAALLELRNFKPTLSDTYDLVHLARDNDMAEVAFEVVTQYERAYGQKTEDAVDHAKSRQSVRDKFAVRKIRSMYRVVLTLCEKKGEWKRALAFSSRVNELLRYENAEGLDADDADDDNESDGKDSKQ